ncbi:MAG TPA: cytochrome c-type biogenesis protein CcmH [Gemmatimonadales bacterium]
MSGEGRPAPGGPAASRRRFLLTAGGALAAAVGVTGVLRAQGEEPLAGQGATGTLRDPSVVGRPQDATHPLDNSEAIKGIEQRLHCTCGCNLDVFTCRTTDFSCTYSPELHREVVALYQDGKTAQQILDAFVAKYGEKVLMAPEPVGFNLWGYLLPGVAITLGAAILAVVIGRRERVRSVALAAAPGSEGGGGAPPAQATPEELERLRAALAEVDD